MKNTLLAFQLLLLLIIIESRDDGVNAKFRARTFYDSGPYKTAQPIMTAPPKGKNGLGGKNFGDHQVSGKGEHAVQFDEELMDILTTEGEPGWLEKVKKVYDKLKNKPDGSNHGTYAETPSGRSNAGAGSLPTAAISRLQGSFSKLGVIASQASSGMSKMSANWASKPFPERAFAVTMLATAARNIDKFANARKDPMGAVVAAVNIVGSFAALAGPTGMLVSVGFSFVGGILSLFGKGGEKPKSVGEIVREQINEALDHFYDKILSDEAQGAIEAMRHSKAFLDGVASTGELISESEANTLSCQIPVYYGLTFLSKLAAVIKRNVQENKPKDAKKCLKYIELYCTIATMKTMILQQFASLLPESYSSTRAGVFAQLRSLESAQVSLLSFLYNADLGNKIMPYFDPDTYVITDAYVLNVLKVPNYSRWLAGTYCLTPGGGNTKSLAWSTHYKDLAKDRPYVTFANGNNCYWKVVPHGKWRFSIVNTKNCPQDRYCGALLSFDGIGGGRSRVTIDHEDPVLWSIGGADQKRIRSTYGCNLRPKSQWCGKELGIGIESASTGWLTITNVIVGTLRTNAGGFIWWLTKTPRG